MKYTVYLRTNLVNGKQYVGQTKDLKRRENEWKSLSKKYANFYLTEERNKYGLKNFKFEILAEVETREEAWDLEQKFVKEINTIFPNGYNIGYGGKGSLGHLVSDETRNKLSEAKRGQNHPNWGKHLSEETKGKMSEAHKGEKAYWYGKHLTNETKKKISDTKKGKPNISLAKKVYQYTLDGEFVASYTSAAEAARKNGFLQSKISLCCLGKAYNNKVNKWINITQHKGYKWSYVPL